MCTWSCAGLAPSVELAEAALSATPLDRLAQAKAAHSHGSSSRCTSIVNSSKLTARWPVRADSSLHGFVAPKTLRRCAPQSELPDGITDLELTRARPVRSGSATHRVAMSEPRKRRPKRTAAHRVLRRVGTPAKLPFAKSLLAPNVQ
jgi:hypothetical protein